MKEIRKVKKKRRKMAREEERNGEKRDFAIGD
jgi:hypothetical protein